MLPSGRPWEELLDLPSEPVSTQLRHGRLQVATTPEKSTTATPIVFSSRPTAAVQQSSTPSKPSILPKSQLTHTSISNSIISQFPTPTQAATTVFSRVLDYSWITIILPLRNFLLKLILWRLGLRWMSWLLSQSVSIVTYSLFKPFGMKRFDYQSILAKEQIQSESARDIAKFVWTCVVSIAGPVLTEVVALGWVSIFFGFLLSLRTAMIRCGPPPPSIFGSDSSVMSSIDGSISLSNTTPKIKVFAYITTHLLLASVAASGLTLAIRLVLPTSLTTIHSLVLSAVVTYQFFSEYRYILRWAHRSKFHDDVKIRYRRLWQLVEVSFLLASISLFIWGIGVWISPLGNLLKLISGLPFIIQLPVLFFATPSPSVSSISSITISIISSFLTSILFLIHLDQHNEAIQEIPNIHLLKSVDETMALLVDRSFLSQSIISLKLFQLSRDPPSEFFMDAELHSIPEPSTNLSKSTEWFPATSYIIQTATPTKDKSPVHIYFGTSFGPHRPLLHAFVKTDNFSNKPSVCIQPAPLSSSVPTNGFSGRNIIVSSSISGTTVQQKQTSLITSLSLILKAGALKSLVNQILSHFSRRINQLLPSAVLRVLLVGTHNNVNDILRLLLLDKQPLYRIGVESKFHESGSTSCTTADCICRQGLLLNRWVFEMLFNERTANTIWNSYSSQFQKATESLISSLDLFLQLLQSPYSSKDPLLEIGAAPKHVLSLETLCKAQAAHYSLSSLIFPSLNSQANDKASAESTSPSLKADSAWGALLPTSALSCAAAQVSYKSGQTARTLPTISATPVRRRLFIDKKTIGLHCTPLPSTTVVPKSLSKIEMTMTTEHTCQLEENIMKQLIEDCYKCVSISSDLCISYSIGFKQWITIAALIGKKQIVNPSIQKALPVIGKLVELMEQFFSDFNNWKLTNLRPYFVSNSFHERLKANTILECYYLYDTYLEILKVIATKYLPVASSTNMSSKTRHLIDLVVTETETETAL